MDAVAPELWIAQNLSEVAPEILRLRLPLGIGPDHSNVYLIRDDAGWCAFDTGIDFKAIRDIWSAALDGPLNDGITRIVVSHHHADHLGLAAWLQKATGAPVYVRPEELAIARAMMLREPGVASTIRDHLGRNGLPPADVDRMVGAFMPTYYSFTLPDETLALEQGQLMPIGRRDFRVLVTGGHSAAQVALYDRANGLLLSGDQMFEWITPNISLWPYGDPEPLANFFASLDQFDSRDIRFVLPGHHRAYAPREDRVDALRGHHRHMLATFRDRLRGRMSGFELSEAVYGMQPDLPNRIQAMLETLSHLQWLQREGTVSRHDEAHVSRYETVVG